ncbi:MAG: DUF1700 domain-containing protein [Clostridiales bacterium]|nr:DUF1700 domain-containing protein [Clostridiales bacterium]
MTKDEFLLAMERALAPLPANERIDILSDYMEHFRAGEEQGKVDEEIAAGLGDPTVLARSYLEGREQSSTTAEERKAAETGAPASGAGVPSQTVPPQRTYPQGGPAYTPPYPPASSSGSAQTLAVVLVVLFNVFIGVPLFFGILMGIFGIAMGGVGLLMAAVALLVASVPAFALSAAAGGTVVCVGVAVAALSVLLGVAVAALFRIGTRGLTRYIRFCERICREGRWPS